MSTTYSISPNPASVNENAGMLQKFVTSEKLSGRTIFCRNYLQSLF
jgi:hypothetical protein